MTMRKSKRYSHKHTAPNKMATDPGGYEDQILEVGAALLKDFIHDRVRRHGDGSMTRWLGDDMTVTMADLCGGGLRGDVLRGPNHRKLSQCLYQIGADLDRHDELQRTINDWSLNPSRDVFMAVAREIFSDGKFNWGRVAALFYFACRLAIKARVAKTLDIETIICWVMDYLREDVISWIMEQGGWEGIRSGFGTPTWQTVAVFLAGVLTSVVVIRRV